MKAKIIIVGSTGKLGVKLLKFCKKHKIEIFCITGYKNTNLLREQSKYFRVKSFALSIESENKKFVKFLTYHYRPYLFLDYGYFSITYANIFKRNKASGAIANKEMIIAGGFTLINKIKKTKNILIHLTQSIFLY